MAKKPNSKSSKSSRRKTSPQAKPALARRSRWWFLRGLLGVLVLVFVIVLLNSFINPPRNIYMRAEARRLGGIEQSWVAMEDIAPVMARSVVAAEDANFCEHWGFDITAIRAALAEGGERGASTISQQVVKNTYLWHGRSWGRKALEAMLTPVVETLWSKRRIVEVYLNIVEFDEGIFGVEAAARHYFAVTPAQLSPVQAARLAAVLPAPKSRSASNPTDRLRRRAAQILDGAATIRADGRSSCFED